MSSCPLPPPSTFSGSLAPCIHLMEVMQIISLILQACFLFQTNYPQSIWLISRYLLWLSLQSNELSNKAHNYYFLILVLLFYRSNFDSFPLTHYTYSLRYTIHKIRCHISRNVLYLHLKAYTFFSHTFKFQRHFYHWLQFSQQFWYFTQNLFFY